MQNCKCYDCYGWNQIGREKRRAIDATEHLRYPDEYVPVRFPKAGKKKRRERVPGCPGNDGKSHVYVWITYKEYYSPWEEPSYAKGWTVKVCAGCGKRPRKSIRFND